MNESRVLDSFYSWKRLVITLLTATVTNVGMWAIVVIMPAVQSEFGIDRADTSVLYTLTMIGFAFGGVLIGRAVDRFGITPSLIGAALCLSGGYALAALSTSVYMLAACQLLIGFGTAAGFGPLIADISHWFLRRRGLAVAITASGNYLSGAIWPVLLSPVLRDSGWQAVYFILAAACLCLLVPLSLLLRPRIPHEAAETADTVASANARSIDVSPCRCRRFTLFRCASTWDTDPSPARRCCR
jgi:MFS family permease